MAAPIDTCQAQDLASRINAAVRDAETHAGAAVQAALHAGRLLVEAKSTVQHGEWEAWISEHCQCSVRSAQAYMRLATKHAELPDAEAQRVAELPLRQAMQAITTAPAAPPAYRRERDSFAVSNARRATLQAARQALNGVERDVGFKNIKQDRLRSLRDKLTAALNEVETMLERVQ